MSKAVTIDLQGVDAKAAKKKAKTSGIYDSFMLKLCHLPDSGGKTEVLLHQMLASRLVDDSFVLWGVCAGLCS
jgi:hypothetical protein